MAKVTIRALRQTKVTKLRQQFPIKMVRFTEEERKKLLDRMTEREHAIYPMTVHNFKLINSTRGWLRKHFPKLGLVSRMYAEHNHMVCWLESR